MAEQRRSGLGRYLREAFLLRWNLLALLGAAGAAALSPIPGAALPLVAAGELVYLAGLVSIPRFRKAVDARHAARSRVADQGAGDARLEHLLVNLSRDGRERFENLRERCLRMRAIARGTRGKSGPEAERGDELQSPALERMLWVFLRLLHTQDALQHFLRATPERELAEGVASLRRELEEAQKANDERIVRSLTDSLASAQLRLDNHRTAKSNEHFVGVELDRIEQKIQALAELAVNRQDPDLLSSQVDSAAESVRQTEKTIGDLQAITGVVEDLDEPPAILDSRFDEIGQR